MKIGYSGEGTNDRCAMQALCDLWCPDAVFLSSVSYRGSIKNHKREMKSICIEFDLRGADLFVFFRDANKENFRSVKVKGTDWIPEHYRHKSIYAVADRNIESWLAADERHAISTMNITKDELKDDPKPPVDTFFGPSRDAERCDRIKHFVKNAPISN